MEARVQAAVWAQLTLGCLSKTEAAQTWEQHWEFGDYWTAGGLKYMEIAAMIT